MIAVAADSNYGVSEDRVIAVRDYYANPDHVKHSFRQAGKSLGLPESAIRRALTVIHQGRTMILRADQIKLDPRLQIRVDKSELAIVPYTELLRSGGKFQQDPTVFCDETDGPTYWLADGYQRFAAYANAGIDSFECVIRYGTFRDAWLFALSANSTHGLPRSIADKQNAVDKALADSELTVQSNVAIAAICSVSDTMVAARRKLTEAVATPSETVLVNRKGVQYEMKPHRKAADAVVSPPSPKLAPPVFATTTPVPISDSAGFDADDTEVPTDLAPRVQTDAEWRDSLPVRSAMSSRCRDIFDQDAIHYRDLNRQPWFKEFTAKLVNFYGTTPEVPHGRYARTLLNAVAEQKSPDHWVFCGVCSGSGVLQGSRCTKCYGGGYTLR